MTTEPIEPQGEPQGAEPAPAAGEATAELEAKRTGEAGADEPEAKRTRVAPSGVALSSLGVEAGASLQVLWDLEVDGVETQVWWGAKVRDGADLSSSSCTIVYNAEHGFESEERAVIFESAGALWDGVLGETLDWRFEGAEHVGHASEEGADAEAGTLAAYPIGASVKANVVGDGVFYAAVVEGHNEDGTVDVLCEADNTVVQGVPLEFIQPVDITSGVAAQLEADGGEHHIEGVDTFFNLFVQSLMGGATFAKLTPAQQAVASEKVQGLRPHFEAELGEFKDKRGHGATVTSEDIKTMLPRVMARAKAPAAA